MSEYIKREDAVKAAYGAVTTEEFIYTLNAIPAAAVMPRTENTVEVVRCKNCVFLEVCLLKSLSVMDGDGFCALGRKDGDTQRGDHIPDATKKVDQFREPTKMMEEPKPLTWEQLSKLIGRWVYVCECELSPIWERVVSVSFEPDEDGDVMIYLTNDICYTRKTFDEGLVSMYATDPKRTNKEDAT